MSKADEERARAYVKEYADECLQQEAEIALLALMAAVREDCAKEREALRFAVDRLIHVGLTAETLKLGEAALAIRTGP